MKCLIIDDVYAGIQETLSQKMDVENLYEAEWEGKPAKTPLTAAQLAEKIGDCDILIMRVDPAINADVLAAAKNLKFIGVCSVGLNHVNMEIAKEKGIIVQNAPGLNGNAVAELTIGKMLDLARQSIPAHRDVCDNHNWDKYAFMGHELRGATLGILGFGRIGQRVAHFAHAFDMNIVAYDPYLPVELFGKNNATRMETIPELLKVADYVTIHMPLNAETKNLISADSIKTMKPNAVILNMARGGIVNEKDMCEALNEGRIAGYGTDVLEQELSEGDGVNSPLFECKNFVVTPNLGAQTYEASRDIGNFMLEKINAAFFA